MSITAQKSQKKHTELNNENVFFIYNIRYS